MLYVSIHAEAKASPFFENKLCLINFVFMYQKATVTGGAHHQGILDDPLGVMVKPW
jgi:hypothetical protein